MRGEDMTGTAEATVTRALSRDDTRDRLLDNR